jgi:serine/threonine protein kinase
MGKMPERLGNYRLTRLVHSGAQSEIWQAMSIDMNEPWVLKVQSPKMLSHAEAARRLRHEFSVASGLKAHKYSASERFWNRSRFCLFKHAAV